MNSNFMKWQRTLLCCAIWLGALFAFLHLVSYVIDARLRSRKVPDCQWNTVSQYEKTPYSACFCYLTKEAILLRVYDGVGRLVAERHYTYPDLARFYWEPDGLGYISDDSGGFIELPPTLFERMRAGLP